MSQLNTGHTNSVYTDRLVKIKTVLSEWGDLEPKERSTIGKGCREYYLYGKGKSGHALVRISLHTTRGTIVESIGDFQEVRPQIREALNCQLEGYHQ